MRVVGYLSPRESVISWRRTAPVKAYDSRGQIWAMKMNTNRWDKVGASTIIAVVDSLELALIE